MMGPKVLKLPWVKWYNRKIFTGKIWAEKQNDGCKRFKTAMGQMEQSKKNYRKNVGLRQINEVDLSEGPKCKKFVGKILVQNVNNLRERLGGLLKGKI